MFTKNNFQYAFVLMLSVGQVAWANEVEVCRPNPRNATGLISCINLANSTLTDTIIDLAGAIYTLDAIDNSTNGNNGLPQIVPIATGGRLVLANGTIQRDVNSGLNFRFLYSQPGSNLNLYNLTLEFGNIAGGQGGDTASGGAIYNLGTLTLENCTLNNNSAAEHGGALYNNGIICVMQNNDISENTAGVNGGGIYNSAGSINRANNTTISNNAALSDGGGLYNDLGNVLMTNSALFNNISVNGAGLYNGNFLSLTNSTVADNEATTNGGGIYNDSTIEIRNSTIATNTADLGGGIYNADTIEALFSNIVADNTAAVGPGTGPDILNAGGVINDESNNLVSSTDGNSIVDGVNFDIVTPDPMLGPMQDNGGPTFTKAILPNSLAINNGINPALLTYDQRGSPFFRTACGMTDIGAFELHVCVQN